MVIGISIERVLMVWSALVQLMNKVELTAKQGSLADLLTALFNNMRTLKFKAQLTNAFFATVNQTFGCSFQLPAIAERAVIKSLSTVQMTKQCSAIVGSWEEPPNI